MNKPLPTLFLILLLIQTASAISVERTINNGTNVILYDIANDTFLNTITVDLNINETTDTSSLISNYKETISSIFTVTNIITDNTTLEYINDIYNFNVIGSKASYQLSLASLPPERRNCISTFYINGTYNILDITNGTVYEDTIIPYTRIHIYPVNEDIKLYSKWDLDMDRKISKSEVINILVNYFINTITKLDVFKLVNLYFSAKEFKLSPLCQ